MTIQVASIALDPPVLLAPMAGITDLPFRRLVQSFGAGLVVSEMVASREMVQAKRSVRDRAALGLTVQGTAVQIAGREAHWMAEAARMVEASGAEIIDINMGCPAKKVTGGLSGSALLKDPDHALSLIEAVVAAVDVPVTLKTRLGWDDVGDTVPDLARRAEDAGIKMITIHGRTRCQFYKGRADWAAIRPVKEAVTIPVIANGDICSTDDARRALAASGADGVMVGRGIQGQPWLIAQIAADLSGAPRPDAPEGPDLVALVAGHLRDAVDFYGPELGLRVTRKHLAWYMDRVGTPPDRRRAILTEKDPRGVMAKLPIALCPDRSSQPEQVAA